jgi:probable HAF family extracellular repeat protein
MASKSSRAGLIVALVVVSLFTGGAVARQRSTPRARYSVRVLPSLGGLVSSGNSINDRGWVTGSSDLPGDTVTRAALWRDGRVTDLGTLGGENSAVAFPSHNDEFVIGVAETGDLNPDGESWSCNAFFVGPPTQHNCVGFVWEGGRLSPLPTLGGPNGFAAGSNRVGQVVGWAENTAADPTCVSPQVRQFRAVLWAAGTHGATELAPLSGDSTSAAVAINDRSQVVGISGACGVAVGGVSARHAVLWDANGRPHDLGNLGGEQWNTPDAINDRGAVTGFANVPGGATPASLYPHAFIWTPATGMRDLGTLPGDQISEGEGINDHNQIVGESCQAHFVNCHAFIWQNGRMSDLNELTLGYPGTLTNAGDINDNGQITGSATNGPASVAYLATRVRRR